jgi:hypothetical protein
VIQRLLGDAAVLEMGEDEGRAGDAADLAGADGDVLQVITWSLPAKVILR